jgi:hypothetical protein
LVEHFWDANAVNYCVYTFFFLLFCFFQRRLWALVLAFLIAGALPFRFPMVEDIPATCLELRSLYIALLLFVSAEATLDRDMVLLATIRLTLSADLSFLWLAFLWALLLDNSAKQFDIPPLLGRVRSLLKAYYC